MGSMRGIEKTVVVALLVGLISLVAPMPASADPSSPLSIRWNAALTREEFGTLNAATGAFAFRGVIGDLQTWSGQSLVDGGTLYVIGNGAVSGNLYIMEVSSGTLLDTVNLGTSYNYYLAGVDPLGALIAIRWNPALTREEFGVLDTTTGAFTFRGVVGDLQSWSGQSHISGTSLYVSGNGPASARNLYILDVVSGALIDTVNLGSTYSYFLGGFDQSGGLLGIRWNAALTREEFGVLDTTTGAFTFRGVIGDLQTWSGQSLVDDGTLYVMGNGAVSGNIYILNANTGSLINTVNAGTTYNYYLAKRARPRHSLAVDFGPTDGVWSLQDATWSQLHNLSAVAMVTGDLDGSGVDDLVVDFGPGVGVYALMNHATWVSLHPNSASQMVTGDLDDDGSDELIVVFPNFGVWRWTGGTWNQIHDLDAERLAAGNIDGATGDDLILDFPSYGLYLFANNSTWTALHPLNAAALLTADLDGSGQDDVIIDFGPPYGLWVHANNATWTQLHGLSPTHVAAGRIDLNIQADVVIDFGPSYGLWTYRNNTTWMQLHTLSSEGLVLADRDGSGTDEVVIDFGATYGLWQYANDSSWSLIHGLSPEGVVAGRLY